eukprot:289494_1
MYEVSKISNYDILSLIDSLYKFLDQISSLDGVEMDTEKEENKDNDGIQLYAERVIDIVPAEHEKKYDEERDAMETMMRAMDDELVNKQKVCPNKSQKEQEKEEQEDLNIDLNVVNDILQSHIASQRNSNGLG